MKSFEIFRSKDPQVTAWLQNNGFRNRRSNGFQEKEEKTVQSGKKEEEIDVKNKEVKFSIGKYMHSKIPTLAFRQTIPGLRSNMTAEALGRGQLKNLDELPMAVSSQLVKGVVYQEKSEPAQPFSKNAEERKLRSFSSPPIDEFHKGHTVKGRPNLSRRYSSFSSSSDRPSHIPVQIRNNNIRLRKYSCPEIYIPTRILERDTREDGELEIYGFSKKTSTNFSQQLATESTNQTTPGRKLREQNIDQQREALKGKSIVEVKIPLVEKTGYAERRKDNTVRKVVKDSLFVTATDINGNEIVPNSRGRMSGCSSENSDGDLGFSLYEEDSLQSYSLDVHPKSIRRNNFPSSMYSRKGTMLTWLGEVNSSNPQFWS